MVIGSSKRGAAELSCQETVCLTADPLGKIWGKHVLPPWWEILDFSLAPTQMGFVHSSLWLVVEFHHHPS